MIVAMAFAAYADKVKPLDLKLFWQEAEDDENYQFFRAVDWAFDADSNLYILDLRDAKVKVYDKEGKFLLSFGKQGQGPGEFNQPLFIEVNSDKLFIYELMGRAHIFDLKGNHLKTFTSESMSFAQIAQIDDKSRVTVMTENNTQMDKLVINTMDGKVLRELDSFKLDSGVIKTSSGNIQMTRTPFQKNYRYTLDTNHNVIWGYSNAMKLFQMQGNKKVELFSKDLTPVDYTEKMEKKQHKGAAVMITRSGGNTEVNTVAAPSFATPGAKLPVLNRIVTDKDNNIWMTVKSKEFSGVMKLSRDGKKLGMWTLPGDFKLRSIGMLANEDYLYFFKNSDEGLKIFRSKIK